MFNYSLVDVGVLALVKLDIVLVLVRDVLESLGLVDLDLLHHFVLLATVVHLHLFDLLLLHLTHLAASVWAADACCFHSSRRSVRGDLQLRSQRRSHRGFHSCRWRRGET